MPIENPNELSERELEILKLVATGVSNKEIAQQLFISQNTVKVHVRNIFTKINAASRTEAAMYAVRIGLVDNIPPQVQEEGIKIDGQQPLATDEKNTLPHKDQMSQPQGRGLLFRIIGISVFAIALLILGSIYLPKAIGQGNTSTTPTLSPQVQWYELPGPPTPRKGLAVVNFENTLYAIGGDTSTQVSGIVESYDPQTHSWTTRSPKPIPVADISAALIGGMIYIPGGRLSSGSPTEITEVYNPQLDQWSEGVPLPKALSAYSLVVYEGKMYIFGGWDGQQVTNTAYMFDPDKNSWDEISPMPTARSYSGAVLVGNKIYVIGGWDGNNGLEVNEVFQPEASNPTSGWSQAPPLPTGRYGMGIVNIADIIFIIGGTSSNEDSILIAFIPEETDWGQVENPLSVNWQYLGATNIGTRLYALGGVTDDVLIDHMWSYKVLFSIVLPILPK